MARSVSVAEPDGPVPPPVSLEGVIPEAWDCPSCGEPFKTDQVAPEGELSDDMLRNLGKLLPRSLGQLDFH